MKKIFAVYMLAMLGALPAFSVKIDYTADSLKYSAQSEWGDVEVVFSLCGNNRLYTFSSVRLDGVEVNHTRSSNNIGGFLAEGWWMGGNHNDGEPNAKTMSVRVTVDGLEIDPDAIIEGNVVRVDVVNEIYFSDKAKFCTEHISYRLSGNSIEVTGEHNYCYPRPLKVEKYYPMQSVFVGESEILTPGGQCATWTAIEPVSEGREIEFTRTSAPGFTTFIEHSPHGYQAVYLAREGLGNREWVAPDDVIFIGNSWSKSYHKCIGDHIVSGGDRSIWHGIYSWFSAPITDHCRTKEDKLSFEYGAYIDGNPVTIHLASDGSMTILLE